MAFISGTWVGFYVQLGARHSTELLLEFKSGRVSGSGQDAPGAFVIHGAVEGEDVSWLKTYIGAHVVHYRGFSDGKEGICGVWEIAGACGGRGGFHIWPLGHERMYAVAESSADALPAPTPEPVPQAAKS